MAKLLIKGGRVISPAQNLDEICDVLIEKGKIAAIGKGLDAKGACCNNQQNFLYHRGFYYPDYR